MYRSCVIKIVFSGLLVLALFAPGHTGDAHLTFFAGEDYINAGIGNRTPLSWADMIYGGGFSYRKDGDLKYSLGEAYWGVGNNIAPGWKVDTGLTGIYGQNEEAPVNEATVGGLGVFLSSNFSFADWEVPLPISLKASGTFIPEALAFTDLTEMLVLKGGIGLHILGLSTIEAGYRFTRMDMVEAPGEWTLEDDAFYLGLGLSFR